VKTLILGGVRSGKSRCAESLAAGSGLPVTVIATAIAGDAEMQRRIAAHRVARPAEWNVIEEPRHLGKALLAADRQRGAIVVDCLTLWLTQLLESDNSNALGSEIAALRDVLPRLTSNVFLIGNETGLGIMPPGELTRRFVDAAGCLHQELAELCERVIFMAAGLPLALKGAL
jgi:adenosylcobinamide kinase/adenosylcobinamide-phosphate guanylyltransferase